MVTDNTSQADDTTAFLRAARSGNLEKVVEFLDTDLDINTANSNGLNALHLASKDGHVEIVTELLKRGAKVDAATKKGNTALHIASLAGQAEIVNILIQYGAAVNIQSQNGFTPLYMAAQENHDQVVKLLLSNGANQSLATEDGFTPLAVAMQQGHDKVVSVLLENDSKGKVRLPALHIAAKKDDCKAADLLLQNDHKPDVTSKSGFTPLHIAAHYGNEEIARLLIKRGADVNYLAKHNISPLHVAAKWGKNNMVKILLENSAQIDAKTRDGLTPLHCAARSGHEQVVTTLLENSAPISARTKNGLAPLHMASQGDHVDAARVLLYHRAPVDEVTIDYLTSLHVAAHCGHVRVAKLLLDRKADPNARALNGFTPLHIACKKNRIKVVELLLKHGASIESTTESGLTPLHVASFMGCMNIVIFLLQHEANPDVPTVRGETPLHLAARANQTDIIRILLRNGAKVDARAREQQTPLHIASRLGNVDIVMLLLQHGAAVDTTTKDMYTALHIAAKEGQEEVAAILVDNNASLKAATKNGFTPLHIAAKYGNMNVAKIFLQKDSKLDAQGKNDISPLHLACHYDHPNVANLLLEKGASPHLASQNGHTPLHIAARKNQMDIASTLLENGANANAESKAGFTPLHLSAQKGHYDMTNLLIEHGADPNHKAKNGLTALHLCAQEDFIRVASILVKNGANVESQTETGYRPIHVAAHFGNLSMIRFLLKHNAEIDVRTKQNYTPLHQAAQQGHAHIVTALLEGNASHKARTNDGLTALNIAQKLGYISVMEVLRVLPYDNVTPDNKNWEEKYKVIAPESLQETSFMSDSDDEGGSDALISEQPYRYLTADLMKSLRDDSLPIDVTRDDPIHRQVTKEEKQEFVQSNNYCLAENFDSNDALNLGFLVSFLVDARGGAMKGCRHSGVRIIVPPRRATMPIRVTCRLVKPSKIANPPPLMEGEALATRIIEMGPVGATFLGPVLIDIPHFASIRGKEREIIILRSENGETWKEHDNSVDNDDTLLNTPHDPQMSATHSGRITRIITTDFPQYFAILTRIKQEVHVIGAEGGILISSVASHVQAVFPPGALTKKIKVGLQAHVIPAELTAKLLGNCVAVSPVITIEPRRRKFHKPITLTIPVPQAANKGMINQYGGETPTLRLLCSIAGGTSEAQWEDVTGSTPVTFMNDRVSFTTTVSARFWLMDCRNISEVPKMATDLYKESLFVPYITNFVIYSKRMDILEATLRILCMTDGKEGMHTLERQEEFLEIVKSRDVEALDGKDLYIEFSGNLVPVTKSGVQLKFTFKAFRQNRLSFHVKVKDPLLDPVARMLFMKEPKVAKGEPPQQPICVLNIVLPEIVTKTALEMKKEYEDSNIIDQKMEQYTSKYKMEIKKEKYDRPKDASPTENKFITDTLQKEQTDAATIHESLAQKAACPLESVDASYPHKVGGDSQEDDTTTVVVEKQTYSEKRKFWEDISRKRESYQRSESEVSRTSQLTINESDSEYLQNVVSEEEEETTEAISAKSETMEDTNVPDISECSVAEKAHYFEEQIQKEMAKVPPKLHHQDSLKDKEKVSKTTKVEEEKADDVTEETSKKSMEIEEKYIEKIERMEKEMSEITSRDQFEKTREDKIEQLEKQKQDMEKSRKKSDEEKEVTVSVEEKDRDESRQDEKMEHVMEVCKELLNKERQLAEETYAAVADDARAESSTITKETIMRESEEPMHEVMEIEEIKETTPVYEKEDITKEIKEKSTGKRVIKEETTIIYKVREDGTLVQEQVLKSVEVQGGQGETVMQIPEHSIDMKFYEKALPEAVHEAIRDRQQIENGQQKPKDGKTEEIPITDVRTSIQEFLEEESKGSERDTSEVSKEIVRVAIKEQLPQKVDDVTEKTMEDRVKQIKKEFESRIPVSTAKVERDRNQKEDKAKSLYGMKPASEKSDTDKTSPSPEKQSPSPTKKKEFESRIPKRIVETPTTKQAEKEVKKDFVKKETETYTVTEKKSSEEVKEEKSTTKKSETFSKTFTDPQEAFKMFEDMSTIKDKDFATVTSKIDHTESSKLEKKEVVSSEISSGTDKIITHEEKEQVQRKKSSESKLIKESPSEAMEEMKSKSEEMDKIAVQKMSMNVSDGKEVIDASASKSRAESTKEHISKKLEDKEGIVTQDSGISKTKESDVGVALRIKRDVQEKPEEEEMKVEDTEKLSRPPTIEDLGKIEKIMQEESHKESVKSFDVTQFIPNEKFAKEETPQKDEIKLIQKDRPEVITLEGRQQQMTKEIEARTLAETLIQSIETELEKRTSVTEDSKPTPLRKEYLTKIMDEGMETDHDKLADDLTRQFESIMKKSLEERDLQEMTEPPKLKSTQEEMFDKASTRDSISISEDITKDEESSIQEKEESYALSSTQIRLQDRDITMSPSSISDQIELEETIDVDTNEFGDISKSSPVSEKQRSDRSSIQAEPLQTDIMSSFPKEKMVSEISGARVLEVLEPGMETESRQDSMDVPSLELDEQKSDDATKEQVSIHKSAAVDSFEKMYQDQDITVSPSTVSEDTNVDYSLVHEQAPVSTHAEHEIGIKRADSFEIESPPLVSPRSKVNLEIKPVTWMIGDKKIEVSETLQPSQVFNKELEEYESTLKQELSPTRDESMDFEQETATKSSEDTSVIEYTDKHHAVEETPTITVAKSSDKFTIVPVSEQDFETELIESKLDISCQELVDTLQREYDAKTPTEEYAASIREAMSRAEMEAEEEAKEAEEEIRKVEKEAKKVKEAKEVKEAEEVKKVDEVKEVKEVKVKATDEIKEAEEITEVDEMKKVKEVKKSDDVKETEEIKESGDIKKVKEVEKVEEATNVEVEKIEETTKVEVEMVEEGKESKEPEFRKPIIIIPTIASIESQESQEFSQELSQDLSSSEESSKIDKSVTSKEKQDVDEGKTPEELEKEAQEKETKRKKEELQRQAALDVHKPVRVDDVLKEWAEAYLTKVKPTAEEYKRHVEKSSEKHDKPLRTSSLPSDTCAFKIKKEEPSVDLSSRYAITVLDQVVKKEIAEVKESLEAAKQDLIEELSENSETVIQIKDSPSEFQFKLQPESIPNDLPSLYKPPSLEQVPDQESVGTKVESLEIKPQKDEETKESVESTEAKLEETAPTLTVPSDESVEVTEEQKDGTEKREAEPEKSEIETVIAVQEEDEDEEGQHSPAPISRSDLSSDIDNKDDSSTLLPPQPAPRRRHKPSRVAKKVTSDSEADVGSSSGDSSYYQSCDYEAGSGSRPSSSDVEALHSIGVQSATASEYETAMVSIEHSASRPTSQDYQTAASTLSSRESMKSLNSLSSGHLGSIDSTSELSETLVPSEADADKEEIEENLECALVDDKTADSDTSSSEMPLDETADKIDSHIPCRMKRSSEMIFQQIVDDNASMEIEETEELPCDSSPQKSKDSATSAFVVTPGALRSVDIMTSRVTVDGIQSVCTQVISTQDTEAAKESSTSKEDASKPVVLTQEETEKTEDAQLTDVDLERRSSTSAAADDSLEGKVHPSVHSMLQQASMSTSSTSGMSFDTVVEKDKSERHSPDSDSFELVDKPDIIDDFVVIEEVGREAEEYDSEGKSIRISTIPQVTSKNYDRDLENLMAGNKEDSQVSTSQTSRNNELFEFESEESPPQASNDDQYSQSYSDEEQYEGNKKWMEMQYQAEARVYDIEYDHGPLEDIKEEEITDFEAGSSRFGSLGSHKESIGSIGSMRGSFGSTPDYDILTGKKFFTRPTEHDAVSLSSLQEFEHLESTVAAENSRRLQCGSQDSVNNGSLPRRYMTSRSGHGDDVSLSSLKDFEGLERACREAHLIELRAREEQALLEHESPENKYKLENLPRTRSDVNTAASVNPSTSGSDDYEKRIKEIDEIIRIAQSNVERMDRQDDTTEDISQIEITDTEKIVTQSQVQQIASEVLPEVEEMQGAKETNIMETSTDSLELEDNADKKRHPLCQSSDSLEMKTTLDFPSLSSDSLNNVKDTKDTQLESTEQFSRVRRMSSDSLDVPVLEQQDTESHESNGNHTNKGTAKAYLGQTTSTETDVTKNGKTKPSSSSGT